MTNLIPRWMRSCSCSVDVMFGRDRSPSCKRHGTGEKQQEATVDIGSLTSPDSLARVEQAVGELHRQGEVDIWAHQVAQISDLPVATARDGMLHLASCGLLDLYYVTLNRAHREVARSAHPVPAPIGQVIDMGEGEGPREVTAEDVYLAYRISAHIQRLAGTAQD